MIEYEQVGAWLRNERKSQKIKQKDFAEHTGYSVTHLIHIEMGQDIPSFTMAENLANALGYKLVVGFEKMAE